MRFCLIIGALLWLIGNLPEPCFAKTVRFDAENFTIEVPDDFEKLPDSDPHIIYLARKADSTRALSIYCLNGATDITADDFISGFRRGAESKGSQLKQSELRPINGNQFLVADLIEPSPSGPMDGACYVISADGHVLLIGYFKSPSSGMQMTHAPGAIQLMNSFKFIYPPQIPKPTSSFLRGLESGTVPGALAGAVVGAFAVLFLMKYSRRPTN